MISARQHRPNFRAERQGSLVDPVINELDAHGIARHDQPLVSRIPNGQTEHAVETIEDLRAPFPVAVNDYLGIRIGPEIDGPCSRSSARSSWKL